MRSADSDSERVDTRFSGKFVNFVGVGEHSVVGMNLNVVLDTCEFSEFGFDGNVSVVRVSDYFFRDFDILCEFILRSVDHNGSEAVVDTTFAKVETIAVVEVQNDRKPGIFFRRENEVFKVLRISVLSRARGNLKNKGSVLGFTRVDDTLNGLHIVYVECAYCVAALISGFEHFFRIYKWHSSPP